MESLRCTPQWYGYRSRLAVSAFTLLGGSMPCLRLANRRGHCSKLTESTAHGSSSVLLCDESQSRPSQSWTSPPLLGENALAQGRSRKSRRPDSNRRCKSFISADARIRGLHGPHRPTNYAIQRGNLCLSCQVKHVQFEAAQLETEFRFCRCQGEHPSSDHEMSRCQICIHTAILVTPGLAKP